MYIRTLRHTSKLVGQVLLLSIFTFYLFFKMKYRSIFLSSVASMAATALAATSGEFNVLTMNVAGLPSVLNDNDVPGDKATNAGTIGEKFAEYDYDMIHVQEVMREPR